MAEEDCSDLAHTAPNFCDIIHTQMIEAFWIGFHM